MLFSVEPNIFFQHEQKSFFFYMKLFFLKVYQSVLYKSAGSNYLFFSSFISIIFFPLKFTTDKKNIILPC